MLGGPIASPLPMCNPFEILGDEGVPCISALHYLCMKKSELLA